MGPAVVGEMEGGREVKEETCKQTPTVREEGGDGRGAW